MTNYEKRWLIMNTTSAPASVQCKVEKKISKRPYIDLNSIVVEEDKVPTFEEFMAEGKMNE